MGKARVKSAIADKMVCTDCSECAFASDKPCSCINETIVRHCVKTVQVGEGCFLSP